MDGKSRSTVNAEREIDCRLFDAINFSVIAKLTNPLKTGEITCFKEYFKNLDSSDSPDSSPSKINLLTGDAGILGPELVGVLCDKKLGYCLQMKGNAGNVFDEVKSLRWLSKKIEKEEYIENGHGRVTIREAR